MNSEHLDFLTPESEDGHYLESKSEFGSLWDLEKSAERGLTAGNNSFSGDSNQSQKLFLLNVIMKRIEKDKFKFL